MTTTSIGLPPDVDPTEITSGNVNNYTMGAKFDGGKPRFSLLRFGCARALRGIANVLTFGANKYAAHSWKEVPEGVDRYWSAMERHLNEIGAHGMDARDEESGLLHIDHVACNVMFLSELIRTQHGIKD
ncbi:dATP/dGTP diphosphohydrolase domain-containing protein [Burkholderia vietnamiensis]|uniref:dATP/dGTP diphosphohydrolase domain-containing protein n=1 Tax=Burkholderia vietnamiensis TaxID=60552 RepID=UPI0018C7B61B|nr:dATP/dGTP diphosphohydrolase domain-containing protein [Burkholderia vietnamiensis]